MIQIPEMYNHVFVFLVPPSVRAVPQTGQLTARKGGTITLECKASGNPGNYHSDIIKPGSGNWI